MSLASHCPVVQCLININYPATTYEPFPSNLSFGSKCSIAQRELEFMSAVTDTSWKRLNFELLIGETGMLCR